MNKLKLSRVFIKDADGNYYRIFSIANPVDHKGEYYLKIVFPDTRGVSLITGQHNEEGIVSKIGKLFNGVHEFSYHYRSGVSHFKNIAGYVDSKKDQPTLILNPALHLVRFVVRSVKVFKCQNLSKINTNDFILPIEFDGRARGFELTVARVSGKWVVINTQGTDPVHTYSIELDDQNVTLHIADCIWIRPPIAPGKTDFEFFRYDDPISNFEFKKTEDK